MSNFDLERELWAEQQFEARANGIETVSFEKWKARNEAIRNFFEEWNKEETDGEAIAEAWGV